MKRWNAETSFDKPDLDNDPKQSLLLDNASWKAAVIVFNDNFKATENEIVGVLRHRLASAANINPAAVRYHACAAPTVLGTVKRKTVIN